MKAIIFDFNRTIYDPEKKQIEPNTIKVIEYLKNQGFKLGLISTDEKGRKEQIKDPNLSFFNYIRIVKKKQQSDFIKVLTEMGISKRDCVVVGDRIRNEIKIANSIGLKTVWLRKGKFANEVPEDIYEKPDFIISSLEELKIILDNKSKSLKQGVSE